MDWRLHDETGTEGDRQGSQAEGGTSGDLASTGRVPLRHYLVPLLFAIGLVFPGPVSSAGTCEGSPCRTRLAQAADSQYEALQEDPLAHFDALIFDGRSKGNLGDLTGAMRSYRLALQVADDWIAGDPSDDGGPELRSIALDGIGETKMAQGELNGALAAFTESLKIREKLSKKYLWIPELRLSVAVSHDRLGRLWLAMGQARRAVESFEAGRAAIEALMEIDPSNEEATIALFIAHGTVGEAWRNAGKLEKALESFRAELAIVERRAEAAPGDVERRMDVALSFQHIGNVQYDRHEFEDSRRMFNKCLEIVEGLLAQQSTRVDWQNQLAKCKTYVGDAHFMLGHSEEALSAYRDGLALSERLSAQDPTNVDWRRDVMVSHAAISRLHDDGTISATAAREHLEEALSIALELEESGRLPPRDAGIPAELRTQLRDLN